MGKHRTIIVGTLVAVSLAILGSFVVARAQQSTWQRVQVDKKLQIVMASGYPPFSFIGEDGKQTGFDTDLAYEFAKRSGQLTPAQFEGALSPRSSVSRRTWWSPSTRPTSDAKS